MATTAYGTGAQFDEAAARRRTVPADLNGSPALVVTDPEDNKKELKNVSLWRNHQGKDMFVPFNADEQCLGSIRG